MKTKLIDDSSTSSRAPHFQQSGIVNAVVLALATGIVVGPDAVITWQFALVPLVGILGEAFSVISAERLF